MWKVYKNNFENVKVTFVTEAEEILVRPSAGVYYTIEDRDCTPVKVIWDSLNPREIRRYTDFREAVDYCAQLLVRDNQQP